MMSNYWPDQAFWEPWGTLVILDRSFDLGSPFMHDYSYHSIVYDLIEIQNGNEIISEDGKAHKLNENDQIWQKYKNVHLAEVSTTLQ